MKITFELQGNTLAYENDAVTEDSEMGFAFSDGKDDHAYCFANTWQDFIGTAFHLIQQTGGTLALNGQQINATTFDATNGNPVTKDTLVVLTSGKTMALDQLLK